MSAQEYLSPKELWNKLRIDFKQIIHLDYSHIENHKKMKPRQIVWHLINGKNIPTCQRNKCNNNVNWHNKGYVNFCSKKCIGLDKKIQDQKKATLLKNWGIEHSLALEIFKEKAKQTNIEKYGVEHPLQSKQFQKKRKQLHFERHGVEHPDQKHYSEYQKEILFNKENFYQFIDDKAVREAAKILNVNKNTIIRYAKKYNVEIDRKTSYLESEMAKVLQELDVKFIQNTRKIIPPYELDFYLPNHNLAIEMNGDYWHSNQYINERYHMTSEEYHQMKSNKCKDQGIDLIFIWETDWNKRQEKIKNQLKELL